MNNDVDNDDDDDDNNDDYDDDDYDDYDDFCTYVSILLVSLNSTWALLNFLVLATMSVKHCPVVFLWLLDDNIFNMIALMNMIEGKYFTDHVCQALVCCVPVVVKH